MQEIPSRWDFEVRIMTPGNRVLKERISQPPAYMDETLMDRIIDKLTSDLKRELKKAGYLYG